MRLMISRVDTPTFDPDRPFSRASALAAGLTDNDLKGYIRLLHGIYVGPGRDVTPLLRAQAALLHFGPRAYASHQSAARIYGLPVPDGPEHVSTPEIPRVHRRSHVVGHRAETTRFVVRIDGVRVAPANQLFVELATELGLVDLVVVGDQMLMKRLETWDSMTGYLETCHLHGSVAARRAWSLVRYGSESPMETRSRLLLVLAGLPEPEVNVTVHDEFGTRRHDLRYRASRTVIEYDGSHHRQPEQWQDDLARRRNTEDSGDRMIVWTSRNVYVMPGESVAHVHRTLLQRNEPGVPRRLRSSWRRYFPDGRAA